MPELKTYRIFISHPWHEPYGGDYAKLTEMLDEASNFSYVNYSIPEDDPLHNGPDEELKQGFYNHIKPVHIVIVLSGIYVSHRGSIQTEIDIAKELEKPIIGIRPRGNEETPQAVRDAAMARVGWYTPSIVEAIRLWAL